jgi:hypothetical protein
MSSTPRRRRRQCASSTMMPPFTWRLRAGDQHAEAAEEAGGVGGRELFDLPPEIRHRPSGERPGSMLVWLATVAEVRAASCSRYVHTRARGYRRRLRWPCQRKRSAFDAPTRVARRGSRRLRWDAWARRTPRSCPNGVFARAPGLPLDDDCPSARHALTRAIGKVRGRREAVRRSSLQRASGISPAFAISAGKRVDL